MHSTFLMLTIFVSLLSMVNAEIKLLNPANGEQYVSSPPATATVNKLKKAIAKGDKSKQIQLAEKERYLKWLHGELKFTKERLAATVQ